MLSRTRHYFPLIYAAQARSANVFLGVFVSVVKSLTTMTENGRQRSMRNHTHHLFFGRPRDDGTVVLNDDEARHAVSVLRVQVGDSVSVTDGAGTVYVCTATAVGKHACTARVVSREATPPPKPEIHFFMGLPERDAFETAIESLVALGVSSITPVVCRHCQARWWEKKWDKHEARLGRIMLSAMKQSLSPFLPPLSPPVPFDKAVVSAPGTLLFADVNGRKVRQLQDGLSSADNASCFVGPPGGFSPEELDVLRQRNSLGVWLGRNRLRTELAATVLVSALLQVSYT